MFQFAGRLAEELRECRQMQRESAWHARRIGCNVMLTIAVLLALLVGASLGMLGGGGSILTVPILRYVLGMEAHQAIAMSLLVVGFTSLAALIPYARRGSVRWRTGVMFGLAGMVGAFLAGRVAHHVPSQPLLMGFALMMIATAVAMLRPSAAASVPAPGAARRELPLVKVLLEGLAVGAVTGLVGAGGGFLVVPALVLLGGLPMDLAVGTSLLVIAMKSFAGFSGFLGHTPVDWAIALPITLAALLGSLGGGALASRVKPQALRTGFGWLVVAMALFILAQELPPLVHRTPNFALALGAAVAGTALLAGLRWLSGRRFTHSRGSSAKATTIPVSPLTGSKTLEQLGG